MVCDKLREDVLISHKLSRMGQNVYYANYATDRRSRFQSDICGRSALCAQLSVSRQ
jgi:hypothetical protein